MIISIVDHNKGKINGIEYKIDSTINHNSAILDSIITEIEYGNYLGNNCLGQFMLDSAEKRFKTSGILCVEALKLIKNGNIVGFEYGESNQYLQYFNQKLKEIGERQKGCSAVVSKYKN